MNRIVRGALVALATLAVIALGGLYAVVDGGVLSKKVDWGYWYALLLLPVVPLMLWRMTLGADQRVPQLAIPTIAPLFSGPRGWRTKLRDLPGVLRGAAIPLLVLALARPQHMERGENAEESGIDIIICLDLSGSMRAILDAPAAPRADGRRAGQRPTRVETAKDVLVDFIGRRKTDRIGVVAFARNAYWLSPPTLDYGLLAQLVKAMQLGVIDENGTAIGDALGTSVARLRNSEAKSKVVILLTDGDNKGGNVTPEWAMGEARDKNVRVYTVQIGNGDEVDVEIDPDIFGQPRYQRQIIPVNPELLKRIATTTGGESFIATDRLGLEKSMHSILDSLERSRVVAPYQRTQDLFSLFLVPGVALVVLEALVRLLLVRRFP